MSQGVTWYPVDTWATTFTPGAYLRVQSAIDEEPKSALVLGMLKCDNKDNPVSRVLHSILVEMKLESMITYSLEGIFAGEKS